MLENAAEAGWAMSAASMAARLPEATVRTVARDALHFARSAEPAMRGAVSSTAHVLADGVLSTMRLTSLKTVLIAAALAVVGIGLTAATVAAGLGRPNVDPDPKPVPATPLSQDAGEGRTRSSTKTPKARPPVTVDLDLVKQAPGSIVRAVPVSKDCMVLSYLPNWDFGHVDNIGVGNPNGGNRTLIDWPEIPVKEASDSDRRFLLAIYSRQTIFNPPAGSIVACEVLEGWKEQTSWKTKPRYDPEPFATYKFEPGEGWKLFDVTAVVRARAKANRQGHGVLLRFLSEDAAGTNGTLSTYFFVSREGAGEWEGRRPVLLVVKDAKAKESPEQ
jgi:hypothetical protein